VHTFSVVVVSLKKKNRLDVDELTELLTDSWLARRGVRQPPDGRT